MSGYPHGGMGPPPPIPPHPRTYRQGAQHPYYTQETTESPAWRIPYQETEVLITTVDSTSAPAGYTENNISRNPTRRRHETYAKQQPETQAMDSVYRNYSETTEFEARNYSETTEFEARNYSETTEFEAKNYSETTEFEPRFSSRNVAIEPRGPIDVQERRSGNQSSHMETEQSSGKVSDGMSEGLTQLGWGGMSFYETSRPSNWTPAPPENFHQDRDNTGLRTIKKEIEPEYEKISMDYYDHFTPSFTHAAVPQPPPPPPPTISRTPSERSHPPSRNPSTREYDAPRPGVPHLSVSDPFPISVDQERYHSEKLNLRESQYPEPVNLGGSDILWQPPSRIYTSYRRTPRQEEEKKDIKFDSNGLPSLSGLLGPSEPVGRNSFSFDDEKRFYPNNFNQSSLSINSTHSEFVPPSSRYNNSVHRTPSYASLRPDNDSRPQNNQYGYNSQEPFKDGIPPPPVRYVSQRQGNKLGQVMQEKKMEYVVSEMNRKDELHRRMQEESRGWGY